MSNKHIGWVITREHGTEDAESNRIGHGQSAEDAHATNDSFDGVFGRTITVDVDLKADDIPFGQRVKWRSFTDDGDPTYDGVVDINWLYAPDEWPEEDEDLAYNVDRFNMNDAGAVVVLYNAADIRRCRPDLAEHVATHGRISTKNDAGKWFLENAKIDPQAWLEIYS